MADTDLLRASRDGDQFHYQWAARQSLRLLRPDSDLVAIAVEGVSTADTDEHDGEQVVDLAEYFGSEDLREATRVVYRQLKHSTYQTEDEWTVSGLGKTVQGFAEKFRRVRDEASGAEQKVLFEFVTNRPVRSSVVQAIESLASEIVAPSDTHDVRYLRQYAGFNGDRPAEAAFFARLRVDSAAPSLFLLESQVRRAVAGILPGSSDIHHLMLKEMISRRATSLELDSTVRRATVLAALATSEIDLLPAPNLIRAPAALIMTGQIPVIAEAIVAAGSEPVIVHAAGGVGKSVLTTQLHHHMPAGSLTIVYDCFGDGGYRRGSLPRHQHQQGLVQLANELAAQVLTDPLVPVVTAHSSHYLRAFLIRLEAAIEGLRSRYPDALLTIIVDAADNAAMFANDRGEQAFVTDLLREKMPSGVRLVMLCRTERVDLLEPPPHADKIELAGFSLENTASHVRAVFPEAAHDQIAEFHRRTGSNPRVQAFVLDGAESLEDCLMSLGEARGVDGASLDQLIGRRVAEFKDVDRTVADGIDRVCEALAALRPRIPVRALSTLCSVPASLVHSLVADLGRPLLIDGDALQFRDEPTETWFREHHRPSGTALIDFIDRLIPLADQDAYVAASLPELMWEAGQVDALVDLALTDGALPQGNDLEQREVAQQRVQYALKATLRTGRDFEAARLALKAGTLAAGHSRTLRLLRRNTDLAGQFLELRVIDDLVATRSLIGDWPGSNLHYEGALLASSGQGDMARSRLRSAVDWMRAWVRQPHDHGHGVTTEDIAELAFGLLNASGVSTCIEFLSRWKPNRVAFDAGLIVANRLADAGRLEELDQLGWSATGVKYLRYAVACAAWRGNFVCTARTAQRLVKMLKRQRRPVSFSDRRPFPDEHREIQAVTWIVAMGLRHGVLQADEAEKILLLSLPEKLGRVTSGLSSPIEPLLCGFALLTLVRRCPFRIDEFASTETIEAERRSAYERSRELTAHREEVVPLADWAQTWIACLAGDDVDLQARFDDLAASTLKDYSDHETPRALIKGIARLGGKIAAFGLSQGAQHRLVEWCRRQERFLPAGALVDLVRATAAGPDTERTAFAIAQLVRDTWESVHIAADEKADGMVALARAIFRIDPVEAAAHFTHARDLTDRVGDDVHSRWEALLALSSAASSPDHPDNRRAYRVAQVVEGLEPYLGDAIDHEKALATIGSLSSTAAVTIASRWRDRQFCADWSFVRAMTAHNSPLAPTPRTALAMLPFHSGVPTADLLEQTFRNNPEHAPRAASVVGEFLSHTGVDQHLVDRLGRVARELGIDLSETPLAPRAAKAAGRQNHPVRTSTDWSQTAYSKTRDVKAKQAREALANCDLRTPEGWENARSIITSDAPVTFGDLAALAAVARPTDLANTVAAFLTNPHFTIYDYGVFIDRLANVEVMPRAAIAQIRLFAHEAATRFCRQLTLRGYTVLDLKQLAQLAELQEDLSETALRQLGAQATTLDATECFLLAATLARRLSAARAQMVLDDFTYLSEQVAPTDFGDGEFALLPIVPSGLGRCIAGWLWVALGDPEGAMRWRAAHSVRLLIGLHCIEELQALCDLAAGSLSHAAFIDARLPFYDRHALQWLLFALARAAQEPTGHGAINLFVPLLKRVLFHDPPHVVMQSSAKAALIALDDANPNVLNAEERATCERSTLPIELIRTKRSDRRKTSPGRRSRVGTATRNSDAFRFFMDFNEHWCEPLGEAFGLSGDEVESLASDVVVERWKFGADSVSSDPRSALGLYQNRRSFVHKSEWPEIEDLRFYMAAHALWAVAGDLVATNAIYHDEDDDKDLFRQWVERFLLSRHDGRWLADRRDPSPDSVFADEDQAVGTDWIWQLCSQDFGQRLLVDDGWVTVREFSYDTTYEAQQEVRVYSALATPDRARALVLALQTSPSYGAFRVPDADDDDYQYDVAGFELTGWLVSPYSSDGCDAHDPLAADVRYPPAHPAEDIVRLLDIAPDVDMRGWDRGGSTVIRSKVWDDTVNSGGGRQRGLQGQRLQIQRDILHEMLQLTQKSLIVEVMIQRTHERLKQSYTPAREHNDDETLPYLEQSFKVFLFDGAGRCEEL